MVVYGWIGWTEASDPVSPERRRGLIHSIQIQSIQSSLHRVHPNEITEPEGGVRTCRSVGPISQFTMPVTLPVSGSTRMCSLDKSACVKTILCVSESARR